MTADPAEHLDALEARYRADLAHLHDRVKRAGDAIVTRVDELRLLVPERPVAPEVPDAATSRPPPAAALDDGVLLGDDLDPVATDDDGIPMWTDPA